MGTDEGYLMFVAGGEAVVELCVRSPGDNVARSGKRIGTASGTRPKDIEAKSDLGALFLIL